MMPAPYTIVTDSTTDLPEQMADELGLTVVPFIFTMEGKEYHNYLDHRELSIKDFYKALREGKTASTSLVTEQRYMDILEPILREGRDIIYLCFSSGLSSSYSQSLLAASALSEKYPERKIISIDTFCASLGQGLLSYYACKARDEGMEIDALETYVRDMIPRLNHWVRADDLHHLRRGGRVSGAAAFVGTMLSIKPMIHMNNEGRLIPIAKARGKTKSLEYLVDRMTENLIEPKDQICFISHSDAPEDAGEVADMVVKRTGPRELIINPIGPVIGAHTGPGTVALFFLGEKR